MDVNLEDVVLDTADVVEDGTSARILMMEQEDQSSHADVAAPENTDTIVIPTIEQTMPVQLGTSESRSDDVDGCINNSSIENEAASTNLAQSVSLNK
jgi:hypothetical protein